MSNWIKRGMISFALATAKVGEDALKQSDEGVDTGNGIVNPYRQNQLMSDLKEGRLTQEVKKFREHHYKVLQSAEKFKVRWGGEGAEIEILSESEVRALNNAKGDPYDSYPVEVTVDNKQLSAGVYETRQIRPIRVQRGVFPNSKIEEHSDLVLIRDIDGKNKLVEFYIPTYGIDRSVLNEIRNITSNPRVTDFVNVTKLFFTTPGGNPLEFEYKMLAFDKVVEYNGNYIVKMFAEATIDGRWVAQKFMLND